MSQSAQPDLQQLKYVLYARKSTEDDGRQIRSIDDQIRDCKKLADELNLNVVKVVRESKSAKKPGRRPEFDQMLKDIKAKKYDAILCWHPDRLSRNMLESGMVIDMLDEHVLQDIRFHSHQFSNDANGKMLLGMLFVFSKQYSDDLSDKVSRGISGNLAEGKSAGAFKMGYDRNEVSGLYEPSEHFEVVKEAWRMRADGESLVTITNYLIERGVRRVTKNAKKRRTLIPTKSTVSNIFHDPIYYGVLIQADQNVDLRQIYDFKPMIDEDTYNRVQMLGYGRPKINDTKKQTFYPLRGFVYCAVCKSSRYMLVGKNKSGNGTHVLSYRCDNKECTRSPKSLRAKHVFESLYEKLDSIELTDGAYERYSEEIDGHTEEKLLVIKQDLHSKRGRLAHITAEYESRSLRIIELEKGSPARKPNEDRLRLLVNEKADLEAEIAKLEEKTRNTDRIKLNKEEFLNLVKTVADKMRAGSAVEKDALCRILLLNVEVDNEKVAVYHWREPFATLIEATENGAGGYGGGSWT